MRHEHLILCNESFIKKKYDTLFVYVPGHVGEDRVKWTTSLIGTMLQKLTYCNGLKSGDKKSKLVVLSKGGNVAVIRKLGPLWRV
jgi:hypothetical protein